MSADATRKPVSDLSERVVQAARLAWEAHGQVVTTRVSPVNGHACMASVIAEGARRLEFVVDTDDPDIWNALADVEPLESWQFCALVRLPLLGTAHEKLRRHGFELQGWWAQEERIEFGSVEIA